MSITNDDLNAFHQFAEAILASHGAESLQELVDIWEMEHPIPARQAQDVAAVRVAIRDMENGDRGRPAETVVEELRSEFGRRRNQ
jgi:hypothetical protein